MRILHVNWSLYTGGQETMLVDIVNEQVKTNDVAFAIINDEIDNSLLEKIDNRVKVILARRKPKSRNPFPILKLNYEIFKFRPDIIHYSTEHLISLVFYKAPKVRTIHNTPQGSGPGDFDKYDSVYAISESVRQSAFKLYSGKNDIITVNNGIKMSEIKQKTDFSFHKPFRMVCVSRLEIKQKGQDIIVRALEILIKKHSISDFTLDFIGDGPSKEFLEDLVKDKNLTAKIRFLGMKHRVYIYNHLCEYDLFIQPSRYEGFGLTVAEAIAAKVPVLVSDIEGPMEIIGDGKYGYCFKSENPEDLALAIAKIIENDMDVKKVESAYQNTLKNYSVKNTADKYIEQYNIVVGKH